MTVHRRLGIGLLLSGVSVAAILGAWFVHLFHIDSTTIVHEGPPWRSARYDVSINWPVAGPLALWILAGVVLVFLPSKVAARWGARLPRPAPRVMGRVAGAALAAALVIAAVCWWNYKPHPGMYDSTLPSTSLERDIHTMWQTKELHGFVENAGGETPRASTDSAINAASRVFNTVHLVGKTRAEVISLLGDPKTSNDSVYNFSFYSAAKGNLVYRFDSGAYGWEFNLQFDAQGKVAKVERQWID